MWLPSYMGDARGFAQVWPYIGYRLEIPPRRPVYAFVEVIYRRDAEDAIYGHDGYDFYYPGGISSWWNRSFL